MREIDQEELFMNAYEIEKCNIEKELYKCSKDLLIKMLMNLNYGVYRRNITIDKIKRYRNEDKIDKLINKINIIDSQVENWTDNSLEGLKEKFKLFDESHQLSKKLSELIDETYEKRDGL